MDYIAQCVDEPLMCVENNCDCRFAVLHCACASHLLSFAFIYMNQPSKTILQCITCHALPLVLFATCVNGATVIAADGIIECESASSLIPSACPVVLPRMTPHPVSITMCTVQHGVHLFGLKHVSKAHLGPAQIIMSGNLTC